MKSMVLLLLATFPLFADEVGPEIEVTEHAAVQQNVALSRDSMRTLVAMEEPAAEGQLARVVVHQYQAWSFGRFGAVGRETYVVRPSTRHQRRPAVISDIVAWVEEDSVSGRASLWYDGFADDSRAQPPLWNSPNEIAAVKPGTPIHVFQAHWFGFLWTAPEGNLKGAERVLMLAVGYDKSAFDVTYEPAVNPSTGDPWGLDPRIVAYNTPGPSGRYRIRATTFERDRSKLNEVTLDIAPEGASAPKVVFNGVDYVVFWSMENGSTYAQRVSTITGKPRLRGEAVKIHDGALHDATLGPNSEYYLAVHEGVRYALLRLDANLELAERTPFYANPAPGATLSLSGDRFRVPMLAYPDVLSRAVVREVEDRDVPRRRRSAR